MTCPRAEGEEVEVGCTAASLTMDPEEVDQVDMEVCGVCSDQVEVCVCVVTRWRCVCVW